MKKGTGYKKVISGSTWPNSKLVSEMKPCPKTLSGEHYFQNSGKLIRNRYVDECEFCGIIDDRKK